jgi:hypothetical protein
MSSAANTRRQIGSAASGNGGQRAALFRARERFGNQLRDLRRDLLHQDVAQRAALGQHLADPQRRPPGVTLDDAVNAAHERAYERVRLVAGREQVLAQRGDDRRDALGDERVE